MMEDVSRRELLTRGSAAYAALLLHSISRAAAIPSPSDEIMIPWLDQPIENLDPLEIQKQLVWENLESWITPNDKFFSLSHFDRPVINAADWMLEVRGLVKNPLQLTLDDIKARPRQEVVFTIECSGNHGFPFLGGAIGNARWAGTPLATILEEAGVSDDGKEVVFWGADAGEITVRDIKFKQNFARSMSVQDAMAGANILAYEMNGEELPIANGFPLRLIAPGWYGIANAKWLKRIEVRDRRFESLLKGRDYVTIREELRDGQSVWAETSVGRWNLKSAPARVTKAGSDYRVVGAAWGASIDRVEVKVDDGEREPAMIDPNEAAQYAWILWSYYWPHAKPGVHSVTSRAIDTMGNIQPAMDDPFIANKLTCWESNGQVTRQVLIV